MSRRPRRCAALLLAVGLLIGGAGLLQVAAWVGMLAARLPTQSWRSAVETTFDGRHPCCVCSALDRLRGEPAPEAPAPEPTRAMLMAKPLPADAVWPIPAVGAASASGARGDGARTWIGRERPAPEPPPPRRVLAG